MENVVIPDRKSFDEKFNKIVSAGAENFFVIADFGRTLTKCFDNGKRISTSWSSIRNEGYLGAEYKERALKYFDKYNPIEIDKNISLDEKIKILTEWWRLHLELLLEFGFNLEVINDLIKNGKVPLREGISDFLDLLKDKKIPLIIVSQGLSDIYREALKRIGKLHNNVHFVSNLFDFDENGKSVRYKGIIVHSRNKSKIDLNESEFFEKIANRKNVLLLGDGLEDVEMAKGLNYENLIKIGFLNENTGQKSRLNFSPVSSNPINKSGGFGDIDENLERFKENFDTLILNDGNMDFVNELIGKID